MTASKVLDDIERFLDELEAGLALGSPDDLVIEAPALTESLAEIDAQRALAVHERLQQLQVRTEGQRTRLAGELAGLRRRAVNDGHRRSPSSFDTSM